MFIYHQSKYNVANEIDFIQKLNWVAIKSSHNQLIHDCFYFY
jgi:hypothetical protein